MPTSHPISPCPTADAICEIAERLQNRKWTEEELAAIGFDRTKLEEMRKMMDEAKSEEGIE